MGGSAITGTVSTTGKLTCSLASSALSGQLTIAGSIPSYAGPLEVTPGAETQTVECSGLLMPGDIIIKPVPQNYGLVGWNGITLTVS